MAKRKYTLRYGDTTGNDMVVTFVEGDTILENLERVLPAAIDRGILPQACSPDSVRLYFGGQPLNSQLPLEEQAPEIQEYDLLVVRDLTPVVKLRLRYKPDHVDERTEALEVDPNAPLEKQLVGFLGSVRKEHRFRGLRRRWFRLYHGGRKLNVRKSLAAQGIESDLDARLVPCAVVGWPFARFEKSVLIVLLIAALGCLSWWVYQKYKPRPVITTFHVTFLSDVDCHVLEDSSTLVQLIAGKSKVVALSPGRHDLVIMPKEYPIYQERRELSQATERSDSVEWKLGVTKRWSSKSQPMNLKVWGYFDTKSTANRIIDTLFVNRFPYAIATDPGPDYATLTKTLLKGAYEIRFNLDDGLVIRDSVICPVSVLRCSTFLFDFSEYDHDEVKLVLFYRRPAMH